MGANGIEYQAVRNIRLATVALALFVGVVAVAGSWLSLRQERESRLRSLEALVEVGAQSLDSYLHALQSAMQLASADLVDAEDRLDRRRAQASLDRLSAAYPDLRITTLADLEGRIVAATSGVVPRPGATLGRQPTFIAAREDRLRTGNRALTVGRAFFGPLSGEWVLPLGYGVWTPSGKLAYILGAGLPLAKPQGLWKDAPLPPGAALGLVGGDGYIRVRYPLPPGARMEDIYGKPIAGAMAQFFAGRDRAPRGQFSGTSGITGEDTQFVYQRLANFPLTLYIADPVSNIHAAWWERIWPVWLLLLLAYLAGYYAYRWALRRQLTWEAERAQRIRLLESANQALEDFAYTIAHDLKAPVRAIDGHAGIAIETHGDGLDDGPRHRFEQIRRNAARMGELIDDLLEFSRYSRAALDKRTVDMSALARSVVAELVPAGAGVRVGIAELPPCEADPALMRVVWTSLLSNAVKYSARSNPPVIEVGWEDGQYFVRDNGVGFDMAHAGKLFGVFSRLHGGDEFEGTGAGLAIARRILERHGGQIGAEAAPGKGAVFRFSVA